MRATPILSCESNLGAPGVLGDVKVSENGLRRPIGVIAHENIRELDIAMDDTFTMEIGKGNDHLAKDCFDL